MSTQIFAKTLFAATVIAAGVGIILAPKIERAERDTAAPVANTARVDKPAAPAPEPQSHARSAVLSVRNDGHYWADALVNSKTSVDFMVDTGASTVALTYRDAEKMGLDPANLDYRWKIRTAGGDTFGASVLISSIKVGLVEVRDVEGMVLRDELDQSLLGMSFLRELYSYEFRGDRLIFKQ